MPRTMREQTLIPVEESQSRTILREKVFVEWVDPSGTSSSIGACSSRNRSSSKFVMTASYNAEGHVHIGFTLTVSIKLAGKNKQMEMMFIVPPEADFSNCSPILPGSTTDDSPSVDASVLHEAGISDESGHVVIIPFGLTSEGFVVTQKITSMDIRPRTSTSNQLIRSFESLSSMLFFTVYLRPSHNAREGLVELCNRLGNTSIPSMQNTLEMYIHQGAMLIEWERFVYQNPRDAPLPLHIRKPTRPLAKAKAPRLQLAPEDESLSHPRNEVRFTGALPRTPENPGLPPVSHGASSSNEDSSDNGVSLDDSGEEVSSDEEPDADLHSRVVSQQLKYEMLNSRLVKWPACATKINPSFQKNKRLDTKLSILSDCIHTVNVAEFDATIHWCSALLFYDPFDSGNPQLWEEGNRWLISDMADVIKWANKKHCCAEMTSTLVDVFMKLGRVARTIALYPGYSDDAYSLQRSLCMSRVLLTYSKSKTNEDSPGPVSRKRNAVGASGNKSKRARNI